MNKINFTAKDNFPLSSDTMDMMQQMIGLSANMALLGGSNYILSGCVDDGTNVSNGIIVIGGEILPFEGGAKKTKITIHQTTKTLTAFGDYYPEAYIYRSARFSDTGDKAWADFVRVLTNKEIEDKLKSLKGEEPGFVKTWSGRIDRIPEEYRLCNGDIVTTEQYPKLAYSFGMETAQSFALPDLRRRFIVGYDNSTTDYNSIGKLGGSEKVVLTSEEIPPHQHYVGTKQEGESDSGSGARDASVGNWDDVNLWGTKMTSVIGGGKAHENRPPYFVLAYVIKVK